MNVEFARVPEKGRGVIVFNPAAGSSSRVKKEELLNNAKAHLTKRGWSVDVQVTKKAGNEADLAAKAIEDGAQIVFAGGGDGTASNMLPAVVGQKNTALGILPLGTFNIIAQEFGIPVFSANGIDMQMDGVVREMDIGVINDTHHFRAFSGVGLDGSVIRTMDKIRTRKGGRFLSNAPAFLAASALSYLIARPTDAEITIDDGKSHNTSLLEAWTGNTTLLAYFKLREGWANDGVGELTVFSKLPPGDVIKLAAQALLGKKRSQPINELSSIEYFKGSKIEIKTDRAVRAEADGEEVSAKPAHEFKIQMLKNAVPVVVPKTEQAQLLFLNS